MKNYYYFPLSYYILNVQIVHFASAVSLCPGDIDCIMFYKKVFLPGDGVADFASAADLADLAGVFSGV